MRPSLLTPPTQKRPKRKLLPAAVLLFTAHSFMTEARACSCLESGTPPCAAYWRADAVFTGVVADIKKPPEGPTGGLPKALLRFIVEDRYRNVNAAELEVETLSGTSCDTKFGKGERWLVYAFKDPATGRLNISPCTRTTRLEYADEDLAYLRNLRRGPPRQSVLGRLARRRYDPLPGLKVTVTGGGQSFESATDADGQFAFALPKPGAYTVRALVPFSAEAVSFTAESRSDATDEQTVVAYEVNVPAGQCAYDEFDVYKVDLHATAEVAGRVTDDSGQPLTLGTVHLVEADPEGGSNPDSDSVRIDEDGGFKFEGVAPGSYVLVVNPRDEAPGHADAPHPRTFYPGVTERSQALPLVVTEGQKLGGINFRVRPPLKKRAVTGRVVWPDGKGVPAARVSLYSGDSYVLLVTADERGHFTLDAYGDFDYFVMARAHGERSGQSERVKVPRGEDPAPVLLRIKPD